jgi:hypothetical protein
VQLAAQVPPQPFGTDVVRHEGQLGVQQLPPAQTWLPLQPLPQLPQLLVVDSETQAPPQHPWPDPHELPPHTQELPVLLQKGVLPPHEACAQQTRPPPAASTQLPDTHCPPLVHAWPLAWRARQVEPSQYWVLALQFGAHDPPQPSAVADSRHPVHTGVQQLDAVHTCPAPHASPQSPQCALLVRTSTSQPFASLPSQLPKPALHAMPHEPPLQVGVEAGRVGQASPQPPQCATSLRLCSHPFAGLPSQSSKPASHVKPQPPSMQVLVAWAGAVHGLSQPPQWRVLVLVSAQLLPQSVCPEPHPLAHAWPPPSAGAHTGVPPPHPTPHAPQSSAVVRSVSQVVGSSSQSPSPALHDAPQAPPAHAGAPPVAVHALPHSPQFDRSVARSKPSSIVPSQSSSVPSQVSAAGTQPSAGAASTWASSGSPPPSRPPSEVGACASIPPVAGQHRPSRQT